MQLDPAYLITDIQQLTQHYPQPHELVVQKQIDRIDDVARRLIAASPFVVLATRGERGLDSSPKGGQPGFVHVEDEKTLLLPDRPGNNRLDGIRNLLHDPCVGLLFLIPGWNEAFRVNGQAHISVDPRLCDRFSENGHPARSVLVIQVEEAFIHCGRAVSGAGLWDPAGHIDPRSLPGIMEIVRAHVALSQS